MTREEGKEFANALKNNYTIDFDKLPEFCDLVISALSEIKRNWIPISERLPEDRRNVLVTAYWHETYQVMMASYYGDGLWWCVPFNNCGEHMQRLNPKAWMPLPEPYKIEKPETCKGCLEPCIMYEPDMRACKKKVTERGE